MESPAALLKALEPWLRVLRVTTEINGFSADPSKTMSVQLLMDEKVDYRTFEALELLAFLSGIDYGAWKRAMQFTWPDSAETLIDMSEDKPIPLGCELTMYSSGRADKWLKRVIVSRSEFEDSSGYIALRRRLEAAYAYREQDQRSFQPKPTPRDRLEVPVWLVMHLSAPTDALRKMMQLMAVQHATLTAARVLTAHYWHWMAYTFCSPYATNRISDVFIHADDLRPQDVAYIQELLQYPSPHVLLCGAEAATDNVTNA